jgi:hypothetical protein
MYLWILKAIKSCHFKAIKIELDFDLTLSAAMLFLQKLAYAAQLQISLSRLLIFWWSFTVLVEPKIHVCFHGHFLFFHCSLVKTSAAEDKRLSRYISRLLQNFPAGWDI